LEKNNKILSFDGRQIVETLELGEVLQEVATYNTGTVTVTNSSATVAGAGGAAFTAAMANRAFIVVSGTGDGKSYAIKSVESPTSLTLESLYEGGTVSGQAFVITYYADTANAVGAYGKSATWAAGTGDVLGGAAYDWRMYHDTIKIHNLDAEINKAGRERILDMVAIKMRNAVKGLKKALATDFYSTTADGSDNMVGLRAIVAETGIVGGIDKRKYGFWQGHISTAGSNRDLTWDLLNDIWYKTKKYGNGDPATVILCSQGVLQSYENALSKVVVTGTATVGYPNIYLQMQADKNRKTIDGGFSAFSFKGIDMVADLFAPANKLFFVNENYLKWRVLKNFTSTGWEQLRSQGKDWAQMTIFGYGTLTSSACNKFGMIEALNEA